MTEGSQEFCLRWNNHQATIISVFDYLLENETLVDCTLAAEGQYLKAHKVVLCACSPYLELLLSQHNDKHPILIFKDIKFTELKSMIEYMYKGEVNIAQDQLNHFLKAAESLQIKGLSESEEESTPTAAPTPRPPPPRAPPVQRTQPRPISNTVAIADPHPESPKRINRNEAASPSRKRRRQVLPIQGRPSLSGDDASNASEGHLDQSNCDVPSTPLQPSSENSVAKVESNSELMLEPKTEYDDNSVEDITLDDDEEDYSQAGTSMDNSQMNFSGWQQMVGDKTGDDVFAGQDSGAQNSQDMLVECIYCHKKIKHGDESLLEHSHLCASVKQLQREKSGHFCCRCSFSSDNIEVLKAHLNGHSNGKPHACPLCPFSTAVIASLRLHILKTHANGNPLTCPLCGYVCKKPNGLSIHIKSHVQDIVDFKLPAVKTDFNQTCEKLTQNSEPLKREVDIKTTLVQNNSIEGSNACKGKNQDHAIAIVMSNTTIPGSCHDSPTDPPPTATELKKQKFKLKPRFIKKPGKLCERNPNLVKPRKGIRMDKISCKFCSKKVIRDVNKIYEHSLKCPDMEKANKKTYICCSCDYSSSYLGLLNTHVLTVHSRIEDKPHKCDLCEFRTAYSQSLVIHFRTHTGEKPFECVSCDFKCTTSSSLKSHIKIHHEKRTVKEKLSKSLRSGLPGDRLYDCKFCAFKAKKVGTLNRHVNSHHPQHKHIACSDQNPSHVNEMLQIEMSSGSNAEGDLDPNAGQHCSVEKKSFLHFLNLETRSPPSKQRLLKQGALENHDHPTASDGSYLSCPVLI